jgi:hypothetical protein
MFRSTGFSLLGVWKRSTRVDSVPRLAEELKVIRDKKERFFWGRVGVEVVVLSTESASVAAEEGLA